MPGIIIANLYKFLKTEIMCPSAIQLMLHPVVLLLNSSCYVGSGYEIVPMCNNRAWLKPMYSPTALPTPGLTAAAPS